MLELKIGILNIKSRYSDFYYLLVDLIKIKFLKTLYFNRWRVGSMDYIYIDESGELAKQTNYFVFGAVITNNPKNLEKIINKTRRKYQKQLGNISEINGYSTDDYIIKKMLKKLYNTSSKVVGIILDKKYIYRIPQNQNYNILYDTLASKLAKEITINDSTSIIIDKCKNK